MGKQLSLIVGVRDHSEITNLLSSIDEDIEVVLVLNNTEPSLRKTIQDLSFDKFTLKIIEIPSSSLGTVKNEGIKNSLSENLLFLDADCVLESGTLRKVIKCLGKYEIGKLNLVIKEYGGITKILANNRLPGKINAAYMPGIFFRKSIISKIGGYFYQDDLYWREDYEFKQRIEKSHIDIHYLKDAIVYHPHYKIFHDLRTAFRCGGGQQIGCSKGHIIPTLKWGGGRNIFSAILFDIYRFPFLITVLCYQDYKKFGIFSAMYKFVWKFIFTLGYYSQLFFRFLKS